MPVVAQKWVALAAAVPALLLVYRTSVGELGANPIETLTHATGDWALRFLIASLAVTPLRKLTGWNGIIRMRRTLGLAAFSYAFLHFATYLVLDHFFDWQRIIEDVAKRKFVTAGFLALVCMLPLAITSTKGWIRRLGSRWVKLHRLAYVAGIAAVAHYYWLVKADVRAPLFFAGLLLISFAARAALAKN